MGTTRENTITASPGRTSTAMTFPFPNKAFTRQTPPVSVTKMRRSSRGAPLKNSARDGLLLLRSLLRRGVKLLAELFGGCQSGGELTNEVLVVFLELGRRAVQCSRSARHLRVREHLEKLLGNG